MKAICSYFCKAGRSLVLPALATLILQALAACSSDRPIPITFSALTPASANVSSAPTQTTAAFSGRISLPAAGVFVVGGDCATLPTVTAVSLSTDSTAAVATLSGAVCANGTNLTVSVNPASIVAADGRSVGGATTTNTYALVSTGPVASLGTPSSTDINSSGTSAIALTFADSASGGTALTGTLTAAGTGTTLTPVSGNPSCSIAVSSISTSGATVTLSSCTGTGNFTVHADAGIVRDSQGNLSAVSAPSALITLPSLDIAPSSTTARSIQLSSTGSVSLIYTIRNNGAVSVNNITIDPYYGISAHPVTLSIQNNTCAATLAPGASCTFELLVQGNGSASAPVLTPRVCEATAATCSVPAGDNGIAITAGGTGSSVAYVVNAGGPSLISICPINATDGSLGTCLTSSGNGTFNVPFGISVNAAATAAFVANAGNNTVSICGINQNGIGDFSNCAVSSGNGTFNYPIGISLNPAGTFLYVASNGNSGTISICPVVEGGSAGFSLGTCTATSGNGTFTGGPGLQGVSFNADGTYAYAPTSNWVSVCPVLKDGTGGFDTCTKIVDSTFGLPQGVSFNSSGTYAYVGNFLVGQHSGTVSVCPVLQDGSGVFGPCASAGGNGTFDFYFNDEVTLWAMSPLKFGYVPNDGNDTVSICPINATTNNLDTCTTSNGNGTFNQPTAVTLSYVISGN